MGVEIFGVDVAEPDLVKILPGLLAALAAALRLIPSIVTSARSRRSHALTERRSPLHLDQYFASPPLFSDLFARRYHPPEGDEEAEKAFAAMRTRTLRMCGTGAVVATVLTAVYLYYGLQHDGLGVHRLPDWALVLALVLGVGTDVVLASTHLAVSADPTRGSAATPREGQILVAGCRADAKQHSLAALVDLGARLVQVDGSRVLAATGVSFGKDMWRGELVWVTLSDEAPGYVRVVIRSIQVDFAWKSRSRRNVAEFVGSWVSFPGVPRMHADA